jgi:putative hydrolase of the HAD superfamily
MIQKERQGHRVVFVDADNTLWNTDGVFAAAQLNMLTRVEAAIGHSATGADRLAFVRAVDQALAERHHLGLRYPPSLLATGLAYALSGAEARVAARKAWAVGTNSTGVEPVLAEQIGFEFTRHTQQLPDLLPGVREGLRRMFDAGVQILVVTEGARRRVSKTVQQHDLTKLIDRIIEAPKSERLFRRVQKLRQVCLPAFMIGDQLGRDIEPAKAAGLVTIYAPSHFRPQWEPDEIAVRPDYRVDRFDQAADIILAAD